MFSLYNYVRIYTHPFLLSGLTKIKSRIYKKVGTLSAEYMMANEPIPFEDRLTTPTKPISIGEKWGECFDCGWFHFTGKVPESAKGKKVVLLVNVGSEGCLRDDEGTPIQGLCTINSQIDAFQPQTGKKVIDFLDSAEGGENVDIWVETGFNKLPVPILKNTAQYKQGDIAVMDEEMNSLYYDYLTLALQMCSLNRHNTKFISIRNTLCIAISQMGDFSPENIELVKKTLALEFQFGEHYPYKYYAVGHAHLDLAWLWPIRETKRKAGRTLANQVHNLEKYPLYIYGISQPQQLAWVKESYPKLYEKVAEYIKSGRIEAQGRLWVECDTNLTSGESLIRQSVYGNAFWEKEFGVTSKICWLPDVFGFNGNLPQILKKCGMDYFLTIKLTWNEHNDFPHRTFVWEGIDDTQIMVHLPPEGDYNSCATPMALLRGYDKFPEKEKIHVLGCLYGNGDGGGGPSEGHIECLSRERVVEGMPMATMAPASKLFHELEGYKRYMKTYKGELYLEKHQGTYTSQAKSKMYNRLTERKFHEAEFLCTLATLKTGVEYPHDVFEKLWKEALLYQFHDIIPGSSIKRVYDESIPRYVDMCNELDSISKTALASIGATDKNYAVNMTSFARKEYVTLNDKVFEAEIPPYAAVELKEVAPTIGNTLENKFLSVSFNTSGEVASIFDKTTHKELLAKPGNLLNVYPDKRLYYNAWDISYKYVRKTPARFRLVSTKTYKMGNSIICENYFEYRNSSLTQKVILTEDARYVKFQTTVNWQETHKMLRAEFYPSVYSDDVTCDIQFGNLKRSTKTDNSVNKAQFEICAHKWIDVSNDNLGFALLSDCKYGYRVKDGLVSLNCLRSPMFPAKDCDKGVQEFAYAIYPHGGDCYDANVAKEGYLFNNPVLIANTPIDSVLSSSDVHVVVETLKMAENREKEAILRVYEDTGITRKATISVNLPYTSAVETDMLENEIGDVSLTDLEFKPFEIKTIKLKF